MPTDHTVTAPLALTMGDPSGVGPDITLALWQRQTRLAGPGFIVHACPALFYDRARLLDIDVKIVEVEPTMSAPPDRERLSIAPLESDVNAHPGRTECDNAAAIIESIERAVSLTLAEKASAVVTNPIAKAPLYDAGFAFPGHTEFLAELVARFSGKPVKPVMMLAGPKLRAVPVTIHIPLREVPDRLTTDEIVETGVIVARDLSARFGISHPRLSVAGLNPHAGESGTLGHEDQDIVSPAVLQLNALGIETTGPLPADTMFHDSARQRYDAAICMYHDQALIPAKALGFDETVNVTLGLPFVRTSPDHGTAFDIAGSGLARADSLIAAMQLAQFLISQHPPEESGTDGRN